MTGDYNLLTGIPTFQFWPGNQKSVFSQVTMLPRFALQRRPPSLKAITRETQRDSVLPFCHPLLQHNHFALLKGKYHRKRRKYIGATFLKKCYPWGWDDYSPSSTDGQDEMPWSSMNCRRDGTFFPAWALEPGSSGLCLLKLARLTLRTEVCSRILAIWSQKPRESLNLCHSH